MDGTTYARYAESRSTHTYPTFNQNLTKKQRASGVGSEKSERGAPIAMPPAALLPRRYLRLGFSMHNSHPMRKAFPKMGRLADAFDNPPG